MKTVGFIDYYLDEWHANNYPAWIKEAVENTGSELRLAYAWAEKNAENGLSTKEWCEKFGVTECGTLEEICKKSDFLIILSPSNPEKHLEYAKEVLKYGKRTYIDKTFAPSYKEAKEIFDIAERYNTEIFSSSALRYSSELSNIKNAKNLVITGGGRSVQEYIVHQVEQLTVLFGVGAQSVRAEEQGEQKLFSVKYSDGKKATLIFAPALPFSLCYDGDVSGYCPITSAFFSGLIADIVGFFETGSCNPTKEQTLEIMKIREAALNAAQHVGETVSVS